MLAVVRSEEGTEHRIEPVRTTDGFLALRCLPGASAFALAAIGASGVARAACVPSPQIIATPVSGPISSNGGAITVTGSGSITGGPGGDGVDALTCAITTLTNRPGGTISGGNGVSGAVGGAGVANAGMITTLTNSGKVIGGVGGGVDTFAGASGGGGAGVANAGAITTLSNIGTINGGSGSGYFAAGGSGVSNAGTIKTLSNSGAISGGAGGSGPPTPVPGGASGAGVSNAGTIMMLSNSGAIGGGLGIANSGKIATLSNSGRIGGGAAGVSNTKGATIGSLINATGATIAGEGGAGIANSGAITSLTNKGTISGGGGASGFASPPRSRPARVCRTQARSRRCPIGARSAAEAAAAAAWAAARAWRTPA